MSLFGFGVLINYIDFVEILWGFCIFVPNVSVRYFGSSVMPSMVFFIEKENRLITRNDREEFFGKKIGKEAKKTSNFVQQWC